MRYAINNWVYADEPLRESFSRLARFGYYGIELKGEPEQYSIDEIRALSREFDLAVSSILGWCIWGIPGRDLSSPDVTERAAALSYGQACIDFAAALDAPVLIVLPFPAGRTTPLGNPDTVGGWLQASKIEWEHAVDSVRKAAVYASRQGVLLAVEPINRYETYQISTVDDGLRFLADVGEQNVKLNLDAFHMNIDEADPAEAIRKAGDLLAHMHVADSNRLPPGKGHTDFRAILAALHEVGFTGTMVLEPVPPGSDPGMALKMPAYQQQKDVYAEESIRYLRQVEASLAPA